MTTITPKMVEEVLKTLPIGYYLGRRVPVVLDAAEHTSFVNLATSEIHVAVANVEAAVGEMKRPSAADIEAATRCALYHELSHVLLTSPQLMMHAGGNLEEGWFNILEDARIEKILGNYYMGVNFPWFVRAITGGEKDAAKARSLTQYIYCVVRYRKGPAALIAEWDGIVKAFRTVNATADRYGCDQLASAYSDFIDHCKATMNAPPQQPEQPQDSQGDGNGEGTQSEDAESDENRSDETAEDGDDSGNEDAESGDAEDADGEDESSQDKSGDEGDSGDDESGDDAGTESEDQNADNENADGKDDSAEDGGDSAAIPIPSRDEIAQIFGRILDPTGATAATEEALRHTIFRALRKAGMNAGHSYGYTGRVDPRAVARRNDYRWFTKAGGDDTRKGTRLHLTLCVDCSGSFSDDVGYVNGMIATLNKLEKTTPDFSFDVVQMDVGARLWNKHEALTTGDGTAIYGEIADCLKKTAKTGWRNVTVAVWDGGFSYDHSSWSAEYDAGAKRDLAALNNRDTIIVSSRENEKPLRDYCPKARVEIINQDYATHFIAKVCELLDAAI